VVAFGGERRYSSYSFMTSTLDGDEWSASLPGPALTQEMESRYPLYRRMGGSYSRSGHRGQRKNHYPCRGSNPNHPVVQSVVTHYTLCMFLVPRINIYDVCNLNRGQEIGMKVGDNSGARRRLKKHEFLCHLLSNFETACTHRELMFEATVINSFCSCDCNQK
jgi:hypothetical protein